MLQKSLIGLIYKFSWLSARVSEVSSAEKSASKSRSRLDQVDRRLLSDILAILVIVVLTIAAFWRYPVPGVLLAGSLALTVFVAADVVLFRRGYASSRNFRLRAP